MPTVGRTHMVRSITSFITAHRNVPRIEMYDFYVIR